MKRRALFVGVNRYEDESLRSLSYSIGDASDLCGFFKQRLGFETEFIPDPSRSEMIGRIERMTGGLGAGDLFLFFFAGHGFTSMNGEHLLFCADDRQRLIRANGAGVSTNALYCLTDGAFHRVFMIDACRTDALAASARGAASVRRDIVDAISSEDERRCAAINASMVTIRSCAQWQPSLEIDELGHGLFTRAFLDVAGSDCDGGSPLCLNEAFVDRVADDMKSLVGSLAPGAGMEFDQRPKYEKTGAAVLLWSGRDGFVPASAPATLPPAPASAPAPEAPAPAQPAPGAFDVPPVAKTVKCPICGRRHREDSEDIFECRVCHRDFLCIGHFDKERNVCGDCAGKLAAEEKARAEAARRAQEAARRAREEAERKAREEAERKARAEAERRAREEAIDRERKQRQEAERGADFRQEGREFTLNPKGCQFFDMKMKWCPPGSFTMGSPASEEGRDDDEKQHRVTLTKGFWMGETEVTQGQWKKLMGGETVLDLARKALQDDTLYSLGGKQQTLRDFWGLSRDADPGRLCGDLDDKVPVYNVNWHEAKEFCRRLTSRERAAGRLPDGYEYRLPTEAEWEYACRAGTTAALPNGQAIRILGENNAPALDPIAWYGGNSSVGFSGRGWDTTGWKEKQYPGGTAFAREVRGKSPNEWGLYDMIGNVWEWCEDWYGGYGTDAYATDPTGPETGADRVSRGGGWGDLARGCRSAGRVRDSPGIRGIILGFRVALAPSSP